MRGGVKTAEFGRTSCCSAFHLMHKLLVKMDGAMLPFLIKLFISSTDDRRIQKLQLKC